MVELSAIFILKLKQHCSSYPCLPFLTIFEVFLCPLTHSYINVLWASIRGSVSQNLSISNPTYVSRSIIYGTTIESHRHPLLHANFGVPCHASMCSDTPSNTVITPHTCAKGKAICFVRLLSVVVVTKIAREPYSNI